MKPTFTKLKIDPEFQKLIPPLREEEFHQLRQNIRQDGCIDPLITWKDTIIDGHNRYKICTEDPENPIHFDVKPMLFSTREAAMDWIDRNQTGRRNLSNEDFRLILGRIYNRTKKPHGGQIPGSRSGQNDHSLKKPKNTAAVIAKEYDVSEKTVRRAGKFADAVATIEKEHPEIAKKGHDAVIEKAKEMTKPKKKPKPAPEPVVTPEPAPECKPIPSTIPGKPPMAMRYAQMAVCQLESIHHSDHDKDEAFDYVINWINKHR